MTTMNVESKQHQWVGKFAFMRLRSGVYRCPSLCRSYEIISALMGLPFGSELRNSHFQSTGNPARFVNPITPINNRELRIPQPHRQSINHLYPGAI